MSCKIARDTGPPKLSFLENDVDSGKTLHRLLIQTVRVHTVEYKDLLELANHSI